MRELPVIFITSVMQSFMSPMIGKAFFSAIIVNWIIVIIVDIVRQTVFCLSFRAYNAFHSQLVLFWCLSWALIANNNRVLRIRRKHFSAQTLHVFHRTAQQIALKNSYHKRIVILLFSYPFDRLFSSLSAEAVIYGTKANALQCSSPPKPLLQSRR